MQARRPSFPARLDTGVRPATQRAATGLPSAPPGMSGAPAGPASPAAAPTAARRAQAASEAAPRGLGLDSEAVRTGMVRKLAAQGIANARVLAAMGAVPRHAFVDSALVNQAYEDTSLPIGLGQTISKPSVVARMAELLLGGLPPGVQRLGRVLEIGTGCGYQAAVLSLLAAEVYSIERLRGLHERARHNLRPLRLANVHLIFGDGMVGYAKGGPYAGIIAAAGGEAVPQAWLEQLAVGGRIVAPTQTAGGGQALHVLERTAQGMRHNVLEPVHFVPLKSGIA